ncbi:MAG: phosphate ABC transporter permease PstA [Deltaproteobacteria bacterium]|nr:phosphate ABC transporter permease PstA [Deltaproteobacteria bacterium]
MLSESPYARRRLVDHVVRIACIAAVAVAVLPLFSILYYTASRGIAGLDLDFFLRLPRPVGETGGGMANAIDGTLKLVGGACLIGIPVGVLAGVFLAEYRGSRYATTVRFAADVMAGVPSITVGLFAYAVVVIPMGRFSAFAGSFALSVIMLPTVARTTEELLLLVPRTLREAALGLGVARWRATLFVVVRTALPGIATGVMLAVARVAGETAPLLFTAFSNRFWSAGLDQPIASLPVQIYTYAVSPFEDWHRQAWAASLLLVTMILLLNVTAKLLVRHRLERR